MKKLIIVCILVVTTCCLQWAGCATDPSFDISPDGADVDFYIPEGWPQPVYQFEENPISRDGFELGRRLFYDPRLSRDNSVSCGTCHQQFAAFANLDHPQSHGIDGKFGTRNAQGLFNLAWHPDLFWDGSVHDLESQPLRPIGDPVEMDENIENIIAKLSEDASYRNMFKRAFGTEQITTDRIMKAFAQFMGTMISDKSRYDRYLRGEPDGELTIAEQRGMQLFQTHCTNCHKGPLFTDFSYRNNGLIPNPAFDDWGRATTTGNPAEKYLFKVPSLRNVSVTRPYMHDGRFETLEQVLDHYTSGPHPGADPLLVNGLPLNEEEKKDIIRFLETLTDHSFITDPRFAER